SAAGISLTDGTASSVTSDESIALFEPVTGYGKPSHMLGRMVAQGDQYKHRALRWRLQEQGAASRRNPSPSNL
ncbi:MAG TPA: hypothetical protein VHM22_15035, partial [Bradyrhizobium sp.]|nr:hypothetical protein [Bradyrhizobium sp.]